MKTLSELLRKCSQRLAGNPLVAQEKVHQPKTIRKPLDDLTNSNNPRAIEKSSRKICNKNLSIVNEEKVHSWAPGEGFLHNHNECVKAERQSLGMSMDYFLEIVALKTDLSMSISIPLVPKVPTRTNLELNIPMVLDELEIDEFDICSPLTPRTPPTPKSPDMDWKSLEFSPLKLKESPPRK